MFMWNFEFQGVRSALTDTVGGAADGRRNMQKTSPGTHMRVPHVRFFGFCDGRTQHHPHLSAAIAKNRMGNASVCTQRRRVVKVIVLSRLCTV